MPPALPEVREVRSAQLAIGGSVLLLALAVLVYGAPRFADALASMKMRQTTGALLNNQKVTPEQLLDALAHVSTLSLAHATPQQRAAAGYVTLQAAVAERRQHPGLYRQRLAQAETAFIAALRQRPADAYSWARLALIGLELRRPAPTVINAWRMSVATAPFEPPLLVWRLGIGLALYKDMNASDRAIIAQQALKAWESSQWRTARLLAHYKRPDLLRPQLQNRPAKERAAFEDGYAWFLDPKNWKLQKTQ